MRTALGLVIGALLLAGCSGPDDDTEPSIPFPMETTTATPVPEPPVPTTKTLYFRRAPDMSLDAPTDANPETTPYSFGGGGAGGFGGTPPRWEYVALANATPRSAAAEVWIRVAEPLVVPPAQQGQATCVWSLEILAGTTPVFPVMCAGPAGPAIAPGDYKLQFSADDAKLDGVTVGTKWVLEMRRTAFSPTPNDAAFVLTSSEQFPSNVEISGLAEPKPVRQ